MNEYDKIITHPGQVHADDLWCLACLVHVLGLSAVFRRDPTEEELNDPRTLCVDVGGRYDPTMGNYDHHQFDREDTRCALSLLIQDEENFPQLKSLQLSEWVNRVAYMDTQGPYSMAQDYLDIPPSALFALTSRVEGAVKSLIKRNIGEDGLVLPFVLDVLDQLGAVAIEEADDFQKSYARLKDCPIEQVGGLQVLINEDVDTMAAQRVRDDYEDQGTILAVSVSHDDRGDGWTLYRFNDHPEIDFSHLKDDDRILFAHPGGFIAKTKERLSLDEVLLLVAKADVETDLHP